MTYFFDSVLAKFIAGVCATIAFAMAIGQVRFQFTQLSIFGPSPFFPPSSLILPLSGHSLFEPSNKLSNRTLPLFLIYTCRSFNI